VNLDPAAVLLDGAVHHGEAEARAAPGPLGGEERLEQVRAHLAAHPGPLVGHREERVRAGARDARGHLPAAVDPDVRRLDGELAAGRHGVARVDRQVDQDLLDLPRVEGDRRQRLAADDPQLDVLADEAQDHLLGAQDDLVEVEDLGGDDLLARERQQVAGQRRRRLGRLHHVGQPLPRRVNGRQRLQAVVDPRGDDREEVVEVMRDPAGQPADRLHLLRVHQLLLEPLSIGDVREGHQHLRQGPVGVAHRLRGDLQVEARAVAARRLGLHVRDLVVAQLRQRGGRFVGRLPEVEQRAARQLLPRRVAPQPLDRRVGEGQRAVQVGDGDRLRAGAEDGVEDAQPLLRDAAIGEVLYRADGAQGTRGPRRRPEVGPRAHLQPPHPPLAIDDAVLDVEGAVARGVVGPLERHHDALRVLRVDVRDDLGDGRRLIGVPAVHLPQLERPEDPIALVIVVEDPDVPDADRLSQALIVVLHEQCLPSGGRLFVTNGAR
jgi:hypothetical protein